jgi:hypothetical protein
MAGLTSAVVVKGERRPLCGGVVLEMIQLENMGALACSSDSGGGQKGSGQEMVSNLPKILTLYFR